MPSPLSTALRRVKFLAPVLFCFSLPAAQQSTAPSKPGPEFKLDTSQEAVVVEDLTVKVHFESDGRGTVDRFFREKIQAESAVTSEGLLVLPYASTSESVEIKFVRVRKPDGTVIETPLDSVQDLSSEVARVAPMYTDEHEKHIAVRGLAVGDVLECRSILTVTTPFAPGQFWFSHNFLKSSITLHERLEISVPKDRTVKIHSPGVKPEISEDADRRTYAFQSANVTKHPDPDRWQAAAEGAPYPDVEVSSFSSWDQVAAWYASLQKPRVEITPEIHAKAEQLTRDKKTEDEKIRAIYDFVSLKFRYIGISLGQGRYMPHAAADVLANGFGDCKDKHTLFAALLQAVGVNSYPVLIHSSIKLDPDVPTPAIFDHLITAIPQGNKFLWLDTTPGPAPFAMLTLPLRGKLALIVLDGNKGLLTKTPEDTPFPSYERFTMKAKLGDDDVLDGTARLESRGDAELIFRLAFRNTPQSKWNDLMQSVSAGMGFGGTVDDVAAASPDDTSAPFWITYKYHRPEYGDWPNHQIILPFPRMGLAPLSAEEEKSPGVMFLGSVHDISYEISMTLPEHFTPVVPAPVTNDTAFAHYDSTYKSSGSIFEGARHLRLLKAEVAPGDRTSYVALYKVVNDDEGRWVALSNNALPDLLRSDNPEIQKYLSEAYESLRMGAPHSAATSIEEALKIDPKLVNAWLMLGNARMTNNSFEPAFVAFRKAIELAPSDPRGYNLLATAYRFHGQTSDAIQVLRELLKVTPDDRKASAVLANLLVQNGNYSEARPILETLSAKQDDSSLALSLGETYLHLGESEKAMSQFQKLLATDASSGTLNSVAYSLAEANSSLPDALKYAEKAVHQIEEATADGSSRGKASMTELAADWDTLGWVHFRRGDLDDAQRYLAAAWKLWPNPTIGDHLGQAYAAKGDAARARHVYLLALATFGPGAASAAADLRNKLLSKAGAPNAAALSSSHAAEELQSMRTFSVKRPVDSEKSAEFSVVFTKDSKSPQVTYLNGDHTLEDAATALTALKFDFTFPDDGPTHIREDGVLHCSKLRPNCTFVLFPRASRPNQPAPTLPLTN